MALYLKYRPQSLSQLIGQEAISQALTSAFKNNKLSHAYLFVGPRGTGKTSTARILAKMVNCEKVGGNTGLEVPCNKCETCLSITDGSNLDLVEIDAASNRGIDDIRLLRENIKLATTGSQKKVYIIDEVHMLTTEAFNALLKTLEEPPTHALFILATTEVQKVPQTILSRVTRLDFKLAKPADVSAALKVVIDGEKIKVDDEALKMLSKKADGSFRDGVKLLDQLASSGEKITVGMVESVLAASDFGTLVSLSEKLAEKDGSGALTLVEKQIENVSPKELISSLMENLRVLVFIKNGLGGSVKEDWGSEKYQVLANLAESFTNADLVKNLEILQKALENLKTASILSLPLELAVVEICNQEEVARLTAKNRSASNFETSSNSPASLGESFVVEDYTQNPQHFLASSDFAASNSGKIILNKKTEVVMDKSVVETQSDSGGLSDLSKIQEKWQFVLETIRPHNFSLEALLRNVKLANCEGGVLILEVPYSFHQRILEAPRSRELLESVLSEILAKPIKIATALGERPARLEDIANVELAADDEIISLASEIFNGKLID